MSTADKTLFAVCVVAAASFFALARDAVFARRTLFIGFALRLFFSGIAGVVAADLRRATVFVAAAVEAADAIFGADFVAAAVVIGLTACFVRNTLAFGTDRAFGALKIAFAIWSFFGWGGTVTRTINIAGENVTTETATEEAKGQNTYSQEGQANR